MARFSSEELPKSIEDWGTDERVHELLDGDFELDLDEGAWHLLADSPADAYELISKGAPPVKAMLDLLDPAQRERFRAELLDFWAGYERDGRVDEPRRYLIVTGRRR
jgi:hypothetical protein